MIVPIAVLLTGLWAVQVAEATPTDVLVICKPDVSEFVQQANATFSLVGRFSIAEGGKPTGVELLHGWEGVSSIVPCLKDWRLLSVPPGSSVRVALTWKHGVGWVQLVFEVDGRKTLIKIEP